MPTVRYEIRNEFGLGGSKLYGSAKGRDEPEAILEGVAVAGLVGLLKQLGDLAEFASEIFHDLHKEVMATATRGHGLMLRVQQVEAEIPSIENAFLCQSSQTHISYNMGTNWHSKRQMDHNLIIREGIPQFIMDSYEECRGPPDLSMLDKYDISGAGACLKRYSDPSFFKAELASSGIMESQVEQEKREHKNKMKGQFRRNDDSPAIFSTPRIEFKLQFVTSDHTSEELSITHAKLKSRHLIGSESSDNTNYLELLREVLSPDGNYLSKNLNSCSDIMMESIASSESVSEVNGVPFDASADTEKILNQSPIMDECGMERQRIMVKELQALPDHVENIEGSDNDYLPNELQISSSGRQELEQKKLSSDSDWRSEDSTGGCSSDDIATDMENFKDALNTMESEVETDCENNVKPYLGFSPINRGMNSSTDHEQELYNQDSMSDIDENSNSVGSISSCKTDTSPTSHSYTSGYRFDAQQLHRNRMALDLPAKPDTCVDETHDITPGQWRNCEAELLSLENFLSGRKCDAKKAHSMSEYGEESFNSSSTDSTSSRKHSSANHGPRNTLLATRNLDGKASDLPKRQYGRMLEIPSSFTEDSPTLSDESTKQVAEVSQGVISKRLHPFSPSNSSISKQIYGALEETKSFGASEDDVISPTVEMIHENSNMEPLCDVEESQEPCNMDSTRFIQPHSWKEELHDGMQQSSKASIFSMDAVHTEIVASFEHSSVQNVIIGAASGDHGPCSVLLSATSCFGVCSQEECISDDGVLGQNDDEITEKSVSMGTDEVCTPHISICSIVEEAQLMSAPIFSNSKLCIPDSSDPSGAKLSNDVCHTAPSELPQIDLNQNNTEKDCINPYGIDKGFSSEASQCSHQEREETTPSSHLVRDVGETFEEAPELQSGSMPKIISFEKYLTLKKDSNQSTPVDPMREPDSDVTANNVSFTEFLKLTQMDWLLNVDPIQNKNGFDSKAPMQISQNAKEGLSLSPRFSLETTNPFEEASEVQVSIEQGIIPLQRDNDLLQPSDLLFERGQFADQENDASNSMVDVNKLSQLEPKEESCHINGMDLPPSDMSKCEQDLPDRYVPSQGSYHLHRSLLPSNSSNMATLIPPGFHLPIPECTSQQPDSVCTVTDDAFLKTVEEVPPLPPLPPLEWRTNKLQMGHLASHLKLAQSSIGQNLLTAMSTTDEKSSHALLTEKGTTVQKSIPFAPLQGFVKDMPQCGSLSYERDSMPSVNLPHMHQIGTLHLEEPAAGTQDVSFVQAAIEDDSHLYGLQDFSGGKVHPLNPFSISDGKSSEHSLSVPILPSEKERSQLDHLLSSFELKRSQHRLSNLEKEIVNPTCHFSVISTSENEPHQSEYKIPGGIAVEEYALNSDNLTIRMLDSERQNKKLYSLHQSSDPLIQDVASHDESTLRKVGEPVQPSTESKIDESGTLLEQIRNKSLNLKPTNSDVKPNLRGPPTNLKIAAILERANAIRQACVGSDDDDDDDGDSWSDS